MTFYESIVRPLLFKLPPETVHELGIAAMRSGAAKAAFGSAPVKFDLGPIETFGLKFSNPLGLAAGFDKNGVAAPQLLSLGFSFVEIGTVTLEPQPGNPKPRLFRLPDDSALINRLGFNNDGASALAERFSGVTTDGVLGVNIGRNKNVKNDDATENYLKCFELIYPAADYIVVNISSPNTPNLRELQRRDAVEELASALIARRTALAANGKEKPILIKIAPDLTEAEIETIVDTAIHLGIAGIVATNTTIDRSSLSTPDITIFGAGGLSGKPLTRRSTEVISLINRYSRGRIPIIGVGGIFTPQDAFEKIAAGASLVQAYTGFVYRGPDFPRFIIQGLNAIFKEKGFASYEEAVGSGI